MRVGKEESSSFLKKRTKKLLFSAAVFCASSLAARADITDSTALLVDGDHERFIIMINGIPVGAPGGRKLAGAAYFLDTLLHAGDNDVAVSTALDGLPAQCS